MFNQFFAFVQLLAGPPVCLYSSSRPSGQGEVGYTVGNGVGKVVGRADGAADGMSVGRRDGRPDGMGVGSRDSDGLNVGSKLGCNVGAALGTKGCMWSVQNPTASVPK